MVKRNRTQARASITLDNGTMYGYEKLRNTKGAK
jgi:hypothetical protein